MEDVENYAHNVEPQYRLDESTRNCRNKNILKFQKFKSLQNCTVIFFRRLVLLTQYRLGYEGSEERLQDIGIPYEGLHHHHQKFLTIAIILTWLNEKLRTVLLIFVFVKMILYDVWILYL